MSEMSLGDASSLWQTFRRQDPRMILDTVAQAVSEAGMWTFIFWVCRALPAQRREIERLRRDLHDIKEHLGITMQQRMARELEEDS